ncbi:MAG: hypothetical protein PUB20_01475 [Clostridia bacterium]|nr:hypothetical protein [Clostridia bacterium]
MGLGLIIRTILEFAVAALILYGIYNEKKLIAFEDKAIRIIKKKIRLYRRRKAAENKRVKGTNVRSERLYSVKQADNSIRRTPNCSREFVA